MARKQDEMSIDDELTAAFLEGDTPDMVVEEEPVEPAANTPEPEPAYVEEEPAEDTDWEDDPNDLPGQLAVDVYETADKLIVKATKKLLNGTFRNVIGANSAAPSLCQ